MRGASAAGSAHSGPAHRCGPGCPQSGPGLTPPPMAMNPSLRVRRSVLDRLLSDDDSQGLVMTQSPDQFRDAVARDLEALLNARSPLAQDRLTGRPQVARSMLTFGVRDFVGRVLSNAEEQRLVARSLSQAVQAHEPRLSQVQVRFHSEGGPSVNALSFTIHALLRLHQALEPVSFDAVLQPAQARFAVTKARFGAGH